MLLIQIKIINYLNWTLLGNLILKREEWIQILEYVNYNGYYWFTDVKTQFKPRVNKVFSIDIIIYQNVSEI